MVVGVVYRPEYGPGRENHNPFSGTLHSGVGGEQVERVRPQRVHHGRVVGHLREQHHALQLGEQRPRRHGTCPFRIDAPLGDGRGQGALARADAIVFGTPTYMGGPSAVFQAFAEASSAVWAEQGWQGKVAAGFTNSAGVNGDKLNTLTSMAVLAAQHGMHWVNLGLPPGWLYTSTGSPDDLNRLGGFLGAMAQSPSDLGPDAAPADADLRTAEHLGRRVALTTAHLVHGRRAHSDGDRIAA